MAASSKYLNRDSATGLVQEAQPIITSAGSADASKLAQTDASGRWDPSLMPVGIVADTQTANASGALSAGDLAYIVPTTGLIARATAAAAGNPAVGFVLAASLTGAPATIFFSGRNTGVSGLTPGTRYYLSDATPGGVTATPVTGSGKLHQFVGVAATATSLVWDRSTDAIVLI